MTNAEHRWSEGDVDSATARIHYYRTGPTDRPPVVLVHGFSDNGLCWRRTAHALETGFDVVMVDARNHGQSSTCIGGVSEMANDLAAVIAGLALARPAVVGHSIGAATAATMAARNPALLSQLVLEDPPWRDVDPDASTQRRDDGIRAYVVALADMTVEQIRKVGLREHPEWDDADRPDWIDAKRQLRVEAVHCLDGADVVPPFEQISCPTLLVHGEPERGGLLTPAYARELAASNALLRIEAIAGAGHNIRRENFTAYIGVLRSFLLEDD
jgi:N-formylmaleamate deformylase